MSEGRYCTYVADDVVVVIGFGNGSDDQVDLEVGLAGVLKGDLQVVGVSRDNVRGH